MTIEDDISRFADIGDAITQMEPVHRTMRDVTERTSLYLEFLAAAFIKETGLKASEAELVVSYGMDVVTFSFRRKEHG